MIRKFILVEIEGVADNNLEERLVSILEHSTAQEALSEALSAEVRLLPATQAVINQREQIQEDLRSILDGLDDEYVDRACQAVVERMNLLIGANRSFAPNSPVCWRMRVARVVSRSILPKSGSPLPATSTIWMLVAVMIAVITNSSINHSPDSCV